MDLTVGIVFLEDNRGSLILPTVSLSFAEIVSLGVSLEKSYGEYAETELHIGVTLQSYAGIAAMVVGPLLIALGGQSLQLHGRSNSTSLHVRVS